MLTLPQSWLVQLVRYHYLTAGALVVGFALWARASRRRPHEQLSPVSRLALALLLAATPFSWWLTGQGLQPQPTGREGFSASTYAAMGINRVPDEIEGEHIAQFEATDGTPYLFLHAPGSLTFRLRDQDHQVKVDYGFLRSAYADGGHSNGAVLRIEILSPEGKADKLFEYYARPVEREADRNLLHAAVALPRHQPGDRLVVSFLPGDNNDNSWDHTFISHLTLE